MAGIISNALLLHAALCTQGHPDSDQLFARLLSTGMFIVGIGTVLQVTFGVRLPVIQGGSTAFIAPILAYMSFKKNKCGEVSEVIVSNNASFLWNATLNFTSESPQTEEEPWLYYLQVVSGIHVGGGRSEVLTDKSVINMTLYSHKFS